ncbi:antA/AntB antirepressor family protein [Candidatus Vondammii sp. HM_W22]|uniref:antA/AntB antirepressor family protein n=1 Tax=Candidatus Vondammii sp. HM_W22 TaxID=2687299 RepID=UPI001F14745C|nr:antA/AntB antirepressor family protein [Candidatus Vondammii sp. HM_W22]
MTNPIPIASRLLKGKPTETVSAKRLHEFLGVGRDFTSWVKGRIGQYGFEYGSDYITTSRSPKRGSGNCGASINYFFTLDMAKELAMVERTDKGREARRYFIECEKQIKEQKKSPLLQIPNRFLIRIEENGSQTVIPVPAESFVATCEQLPDFIRESFAVEDKTLEEIIVTCAQLLSSRSAYYRKEALATSAE